MAEIKLATQEKHDTARQQLMRERARQTAAQLKHQKGVVGIVLSGSAARGPVGEASDLDMHVIVSKEHDSIIPEWTFHDDGIIENIHTLPESELQEAWGLLDKPDELAAWFYKTKLGDEMNGFLPLWWAPHTVWRDRLDTIITTRQTADISHRLAELYTDAARTHLGQAEQACKEGAALDAHHLARLAFQATLIATLIRHDWIMRGSKKRIEIAEAFLPDPTVRALLEAGDDIVGMQDMTAARATAICNARLQFRQTFVHELQDQRTRHADDGRIAQAFDEAIAIQKAHEAQAYDYYSPLVRKHIIRGPINHLRCLSGLMRVPQTFVSRLYDTTEAWPITRFMQSNDISKDLRSQWLQIMDLDDSAAHCLKMIQRLHHIIDSSDYAKLVLPSDYDLSRVRMTETHITVTKRDTGQGGEAIHIDTFDFPALRKQTEAAIAFFKDKDFTSCKTTAEKILRIVTSPKYRAGSAAVLDLEHHKDAMLAKLEYHIARNEPVEFMLPAFPFKVRNPLKSSRMTADLAEVASFCKFNEIHVQISQVYAPGAAFHIFHDGHLYYRHFLHTKEDADNYFTALKGFVRALGLEKVVILHDAFAELQRFHNFPEVYEEARAEMQSLWDLQKDTDPQVLIIRRSARDNINVSDINEDVLYEVAVQEDAMLSDAAKAVKAEISRRADLCAFEYMIVQHALERVKFFALSLPHGVRMTVHPKEGQIGLYLVKRTTFLLPWMGVGVLKKNGEMSVRYERDVKHNANFSPVHIGTETTPFYYLELRP